jgi:hypothetical protein
MAEAGIQLKFRPCFFTNIVKRMLLSTRCKKCEKAKVKCDDRNCSKNWDGSIKGMEARACLNGVKELYDENDGNVRIKTIYGDDDISFRKILKPISEGGSLHDKYGIRSFSPY